MSDNARSAARTPRPELSDEELARITQALFDVLPGAGLFDNVPSDWTWGELVQAVAAQLGAVAAGAGDDPHSKDCNTQRHLHRRDVKPWRTADGVLWEAACDCGAGDRPPAPSAHTLIDFALDEIIRLGQEARPFVDEVAIAKHRGAIHDAVRAVRPTPRAALTVEGLAGLLKLLAHTAEIPQRTYEAEAAWLLPRLGAASPAAAPREEKP